MPSYTAWSQLYLPEGEIDMYTCFLEEATWRQIHEEHIDAKRIFASIRSGPKHFVCALGHPVRGGLESERPLYLPGHLLESLHVAGAGETIEVDWITEEFAPSATKIVLKPSDPIFFEVNARDELEPALTRYGMLQVGTSVPVPLEALGGLLVSMEVVRCLPADLVLMEGDEVEMEFEGYPAAPVAAAASAPLATEPMIPIGEPTAQTPRGHVLGGAPRPRLPDGRAWNPWRA